MKAPRRPQGGPPDHGADSVNSFAAKHNIGRDLVYKEIAAGRLTARKVNSRTIITKEDGARWRRRLPKMPAKTAGANGKGRLIADRVVTNREPHEALSVKGK
jgi:hypothetical protein